MYQWDELANQSQRMSFEVNVKDDLTSLFQGRIKEAEFPHQTCFIWLATIEVNGIGSKSILFPQTIL